MGLIDHVHADGSLMVIAAFHLIPVSSVILVSAHFATMLKVRRLASSQRCLTSIGKDFTDFLSSRINFSRKLILYRMLKHHFHKGATSVDFFQESEMFYALI